MDIAAALFISLVTLASMALADPSQTRGEAAQMNVRIGLQKAIVSAVEKAGVLVLASGRLSDICASLAVYSNETVSFNAVLDGEQCMVPERGVTMSNLTMSFPRRRVVLEAWSLGSAE